MVLLLLLDLCLAEGMNPIGQTVVINDRRLVVTQSVCRAFSVAQNRDVDRMRLRKAARRSLRKGGVTNGAEVGEISGLRVESVNYIGSNMVEAVFSVIR